ncbi:glycosyltransferase [Paenibacillus validus]|uniref:glycosyltransferase n=1 Tax=Paenibacillus validus TaxID=44253 RepID=UPI003D2A2F7A
MRILHVISNLAPRYGGPVKAVLEMSKALANLGHEVRIFTTDQDGDDRLSVPLFEPVVKDGVEITYFPVQKPNFWSTSMPLANALKEEIPKNDIVHIHALYMFHNFAAGHYCRKYKVPYIVCPHGSLDPFIYKRHRNRKRLLEFLFEKRNFKHAAALHFITEEEMNLAKPVSYETKGMVVPLGLDLAEFQNMPEQGAFRNRYEQLKGKKIILFFGRLNYKKGLDLLVNAFSVVIKDHPDAALVITGPDNESYGEQVKRWVLDKKLSDHVIFTGMLRDQDKLAVLQDADVFVLPSYSENFGIAVIESLICKTPVIISDKVNICKEIEDNGAGLITQCNEESVADRIRTLLEDSDLRNTMGKNGEEMVRKYFHWDQIGQSLENEYNNVIRHELENKYLKSVSTS